MCCAVGSVVGLLYILGLLFATFDYGSITGGISDPIINVYVAALGQNGGLALTILLIFNLFFAGISSVTVTSRIGFAMTRDGAFPFSKFWFHTNKYTKSPMRVVFLVWVVDSLLLILPVINTTAFNAIVSLTTIGYKLIFILFNS